MFRKIIHTLLILLVFTACEKKSDTVHLSDIQVIGSHNSYKIAIEKPLWDYMFEMDSAMANSLQYDHLPIANQLEMGLRNIELDVFHDPKGGHYSNPKGLELIKSHEGTSPVFDPDDKLKQPGLKMFHIQDVDFRSHFLLFKDCLKMMKKWSDENPDHAPVFVLMNTKDQKVKGTRDPLPFTKQALDSVDMEIRAVFSDAELITPDFVRGKYASPEEAILKQGWPALKAVKGRFMFILDEKKDKIDLYLQGHEALKGRVLFVNSPEGNPEAAFRIINNPVDDFEYIQSLVAKGYLVRTRADAGTLEARKNDYTRFLKAQKSGAQVISTDYYLPSTLFESSYQINFDNNTFERIKE